MQCTSIKPGYECTFMTQQGCGYGAPSETCEVVVEQCAGCNHIHTWESGEYCKQFASPAAKWTLGHCNMGTHVKYEAKKQQKVNPLKASKRGGR